MRDGSYALEVNGVPLDLRLDATARRFHAADASERDEVVDMLVRHTTKAAALSTEGRLVLAAEHGYEQFDGPVSRGLLWARDGQLHFFRVDPEQSAIHLGPELRVALDGLP